jgi:hypothetical protein
MTHLEFAALESRALDIGPWDRWIEEAEALAGHSLDGDEPSGDGYSLDSAHYAYEAGYSPAEYVEQAACTPRRAE